MVERFVSDANLAAWWSATARLAAGVCIGLAAFAGLVLIFAPALDHGRFIGLPFGYFLIALATPTVLAVAIFWFADRQRGLDHRYDVIED